MQVSAIGFSGQMQGTVFLDKNFQPVRNCMIWMDQRAVEEVGEIERRIEEAGTDIMAVTANHCLNSFWAPKILWLKKHEPENYEKIEKTGEKVLEKVNRQLKIRAEICLKAAYASFCLGHEEKMMKVHS